MVEFSFLGDYIRLKLVENRVQAASEASDFNGLYFPTTTAISAEVVLVDSRSEFKVDGKVGSAGSCSLERWLKLLLGCFTRVEKRAVLDTTSSIRQSGGHDGPFNILVVCETDS